jgi:hypothetical protein
MMMNNVHDNINNFIIHISPAKHRQGLENTAKIVFLMSVYDWEVLVEIIN